MAVNLTVLRQRHEADRLARLRHDDSRTAISAEAARALSADLARAVEGEVRFDDGSRALYATDASNYRQVPIGVVIPRHKGDVIATVDLCRRHGAPVLPRGGGTSLAGQCCNVAVVIDFTKYMHHVLAVDGPGRLGSVQPGCVLDTLQAAARPHGLVFGPDPATHTHCAVGGMLGNNSCGAHSLIAKNAGRGLRTSDNTHELEVLTHEGTRFRVGPTTPDELQRIIAAGGRRGEIYGKLEALVQEYADDIRSGFPKLDRRVSGYNLDDLLPERGFHVARALVGSEGTLVTFLEATMHLVAKPRSAVLAVLGYPDVAAAGDHVPDILAFRPTAVEGMDRRLVRFVREKGTHARAAELLPEGDGFLYVEFGGESPEEARDAARRCVESLRQHGNAPEARIVTGGQEMEKLWNLREAGLGSTAFVPSLPDTWPGWEDSAVPVARIGPYLRELRGLFERFGYQDVSTYGHFGQGVVHCRIPFDLATRPGIETFRGFLDEASDLVVRYGGCLSGEHGDGQARGVYLPKVFGPRLMRAFREFKQIWDPRGKMNPGKMIDAYDPDENLRLGADYAPPQPPTAFRYPSDGSLSRAALRCVGVGKCRRESGGTMCPSYMVTREEKHSTRGRARLLWELLNGEVLSDGWRNEAVKDALDLCLMCKGCKGDCPVNVDVATYKAEFLSHYYAGRVRPREAYAFGWIGIWSQLASAAPTLANAFTRTPGLRTAAKWLAGMSQARTAPLFAPRTFKATFAEHRPRHPQRQPVLLFADTFHNYFHPDVAEAAVEVLEDAGCRVIVPGESLCCGRPLYDYGFTGMARRWLLEVLAVLRPHIRAGVPVVVLEPSCWSVFADELGNLFPEDEDAKRLRQNVYMLGQFLRLKRPEYRIPRLDRDVLLHRHCHDKSELKLSSAATELLGQLGGRCDEPEAGCCGMAGAFGYTAGDKYDVSVKCGERALLPAVRQAPDETLIVADGFSCREMISQGGTGRHALHTAQVLQLAIQQSAGGHDAGPGRPAEAAVVERRRAAHRQAAVRTAAMVVGGITIGALGYFAAARLRPLWRNGVLISGQTKVRI